MSRTALAPVAALAVLAACGEPDAPAEKVRPGAQPPPEQRAPARAPTRPGRKLVLGQSQFGRVLFDSRRQAIYLFDRESTKKPRCYGACAQAWPPVYADGRPRVGRGLKRSLLGTTRRRDGRRQVTYGGHPLYYYAHEGRGQVLCHDVEEFGGLWLAVRRSGDPAPSGG
jgi:predicted lipoprotein with Yx(FWY)xxD motif